MDDYEVTSAHSLMMGLLLTALHVVIPGRPRHRALTEFLYSNIIVIGSVLVWRGIWMMITELTAGLNERTTAAACSAFVS